MLIPPPRIGVVELVFGGESEFLAKFQPCVVMITAEDKYVHDLFEATRSRATPLLSGDPAIFVDQTGLRLRILRSLRFF